MILQKDPLGLPMQTPSSASSLALFAWIAFVQLGCKHHNSHSCMKFEIRNLLLSMARASGAVRFQMERNQPLPEK